jgi:tetratricopeptide (TPR) repeat protein
MAPLSVLLYGVAMWSRCRSLVAGAVVIVVVSGCGQGDSDGGTTLEVARSDATTTISGVVSTTSVESTPFADSDLPEAAVDLAVGLECASAEMAGGTPPETLMTIDCQESPHGASLEILLFEDLEQANRYLGYFQTSQIVGSDTWMVTGTFGDIDKTADTVGGISVIRDNLGSRHARSLTADEARFLFDEAVRYADAGAIEYALKLFDQTVRSIPLDSEPDLIQARAVAMLAKGTTYGNLEMYEDAVSSYREMIDTYADSSDTWTHGATARAMYKSAFALGMLKRYEESIVMFDAAIDQVQSNPDKSLVWMGADAMFNKAIAVNLAGDPDAAVEIMRLLIETYAGTDDDTIRVITKDAQQVIDEQP